MQGRLELSSPEATCLLAARKKRKSLVLYLYHILVYDKHIIIDWMHILSPCHLTNDSLNTPFQDWFIHGIILNKKVTVARGHLASREEGRMVLLAVPARKNGSDVWTGKMENHRVGTICIDLDGPSWQHLWVPSTYSQALELIQIIKTN